MTARLPSHPEEDRLLELAYGEAPAAEARVLQQHVDGCARCREVLQGIAEVRSAVRAVPPEPAPERGLESLLAYGEQAAARARVRRRSFRLLGLLSVATAAGLVWVLLPAGPRQRPAAQETLARADTPAPAGMESPVPEMKASAPAAGPENERAGQAASGAVAAAEPSLAQRRKEAPKVVAAEHRPPAVVMAPPAEKEEQVQGSGGKSVSAQLDSAESKKRAEQSPQVLRSTSSAAAAGNAQKTRAASEGTVDKKQSMSGAGLAASAPPGSSGKDISSPVAAADSAAEVGSAGRMATASSPAPAAQPLRPADRPAKAARLDEVRRDVTQATGDQRKALLLEQCRLEAELLMGPAAVQTCSQVAREFPGTPEAKQATDLASGFSVQPAPR